MEAFVFVRLHECPEPPHMVRFVQAVEPLLDPPFKVTLVERPW